MRVLPLWSFVELFIVVFILHINGALATQLRSYKKEPLAWISVVSVLLNTPLSIWAAMHFSSYEVVSIMLSVQLFFTLPVSIIVWKKYNQCWRS